MFNNPFSMVVAIVAIVSIASIVRARFGLHRGGGRHGHHQMSEAAASEIVRLTEDVRGLKERVAVLERLATDDRSALDREFERLRREP